MPFVVVLAFLGFCLCIYFAAMYWPVKKGPESGPRRRHPSQKKGS